MSFCAPPCVTIGLPVFNAGSTVSGAIESLLGQSHDCIRLVISDNASTDATGDICRRFAVSDSRVVYFRQERNIGAEANFAFVLAKAETAYFMWAAADDIRSPDYVALCVDFLDGHPAYVAATCPTRYVDRSLAHWEMGDDSLDSDDLYVNIINFFPRTSSWHANAHFYSLFRCDALRASTQGAAHYLGADWATVVKALAHGKFHRVDQGHVFLGAHGTSRRLDFFRRYRSKPIHWVIPFLEFSGVVISLCRKAPFGSKLRLAGKLLILNVQGTIKHIKYERRIRQAHRKNARA